METLNRREFVAGLAVLPGSAAGLSAKDAPLREAAAARNILFGSMVTLGDIVDPAYASLITAQCGIITPGVEAKWRNTEPEDGVFRFGPMDALAGFAAGAGLRLHMHNLIWAVGLPAWTLAALKQGRGRAVMRRHIQAVAGRYRGRVHSWDVVNEAVDTRWPADPSGILTTPWWHGLGPEFITEAFADAAAADPGAELMINEDDLEYDLPTSQAKRRDCLRLAETWLRSGVKLRAFGLETHLKPWLPIAVNRYRRFLSDMAGLGLKLRITEFDVNDRFFPADINLRDQMVADAAKHFLDLALDEPGCDALILWGLTDRSSWMCGSPAALRADRLAPRPLPYDAHLSAKPLRQAILSALRSAPSRPG